jgi:hypothetical protein
VFVQARVYVFRRQGESHPEDRQKWAAVEMTVPCSYIGKINRSLAALLARPRLN